MDSHAKMSVSANENEQNAKLMAELAREEARNAEAIRMVKEKELQALAAKDRAADSQRRMQDMVVRYEEMKQKLEWTRLTLEHTASQINQNDIKRAQQIQATVSRLKEKAEHCSGILKRKRERDGVNASTYIAENQEDTDAFAADTGNSLSEVEKKLLLLCQSQATANTEKTTDENNTSSAQDDFSASTQPQDQPIENAHEDSSLTDAEKMLLLMCQKQKSEQKEENEKVENIVKDSDANGTDETFYDAQENVDIKTESNTPVAETKEVDHDKHLNQDDREPDVAVITVDALETIEVAEPKLNAPEKQENAADTAEIDLKEVTKDLKETVTNIEAKCAGVRDELGQMAMSEQYMRTKQAQLLAKRKERDAEKALEAAARKELEAEQMRQKVANMMKLLEERKNKLKQTENVLENRANVVDKVNKVLDSKLRKVDFVSKKRDECLAFDIKHKTNLVSTEKENSQEIETVNEGKVEDQNITENEGNQEAKERNGDRSSNNNDASTTNINQDTVEKENQDSPKTETQPTMDSNESQL